MTASKEVLAPFLFTMFVCGIGVEASDRSGCRWNGFRCVDIALLWFGSDDMLMDDNNDDDLLIFINQSSGHEVVVNEGMNEYLDFL